MFSLNPLKLKVQKPKEENVVVEEKKETKEKSESVEIKENTESVEINKKAESTELKENKESVVISSPMLPMLDDMESNVYLEDDFSIVFNDVVNKNTVKKAIELLKTTQKKALMLKYSDNIERDVHINFYINSPGGSVIDGFILVDLIEKSPIPVYTIVRGMAASMAIPLLLAGSKRYSYKHSVFLIHQMSTILVGKMEEIRDNLKLSTNLEDMIKSYILEKTKIKEKEIEEIYKRETWLNSEEALKYGVIDEVI